MTQCEMILEYMKDFGSITQAEAWYQFGCSRLAARISDLEKKGHKINHTPDFSVNRYGIKVPFTRYSLEF